MSTVNELVREGVIIILTMSLLWQTLEYLWHLTLSVLKVFSVLQVFSSGTAKDSLNKVEMALYKMVVLGAVLLTVEKYL